MDRKSSEYYIGLDIGSNSVGWAVTTPDYKLCRFKGNSMWGTRLFDESETAEKRRVFRSSRRRYARKRDRISWLQMLFSEEIAKIDPSFFIRLKESNLYADDKTEKLPYSVFADAEFTDKDYHEKYKTIYHLRKELIDNKAEHDIRLVYLALHHIIKNRGHFLFDNLGEDIDSVNSFDRLFMDFRNFIKEEFDIEVVCDNVDKFAETLKDEGLKKPEKSKILLDICNITKKSNPQLAEMLTLMYGGSVKLSALFNDDSFNNKDMKTISFTDKYDEKEESYRDYLKEDFELIEKIKAIYNWAILDKIRNGHKYICHAKAESYDIHSEDLHMLKTFVRENCPEEYDTIFKISEKEISGEKLYNYTAYSGRYVVNGHKAALKCRATQADFCKFLKNEIIDKFKNKLPELESKYELMFRRIENATFMPKQVTTENGIIPMQLNRQELKAILDNAAEYLPFLNSVDENEISIKEKIVKIFEFRVPYYVGPLNANSPSPNHWLVRTNEKIYPWNFERVVDIEKSAEAFINNLTNKCTYLYGKDVIPKNSILYSKFTVLNELNNLKINGEKIEVREKQELFNALFLKRKKVTQKAVQNFFKSAYGDNAEITGIDNDFKSSMKSYIELAAYNLTVDEKEDIISAITIFGDDKNLLKKRLQQRFFHKLTKDEINSISRLKYSGWGRLSKEFLTEIIDPKMDSEDLRGNIINALWQTNDNLMELLGSKYNFGKAVEDANDGFDNGGTLKEMVDNLYVSPSVKRPIYQAISIAKEIDGIMGKAPKKIFVETTRSVGEKGDKGRTTSRKDQLIKLYESCKKDTIEHFDELYTSLKKVTETDSFISDRLYLYYTQFGRCMYSFDFITFDQITDKNIYDIDHIYPRSKVKDDSLDNRVLVKKVINQGDKKDIYPISSEIQGRMKGFWQALLKKNLISRKKYERLTRVTPLTDDELADFISRQLVETSQSTKAVASILKKIYPDTEIVYVKAKTVSRFRDEHKSDMLKCRAVNDFHHAKDAYLNIVVGNVYNVLFTHNKANFIKRLQKNHNESDSISLNKIFDFDINGAWVAKNGESMSVVRNTMHKNNIIVTRYAYTKGGQLFDQNPLGKGDGKVPLKAAEPYTDLSKYGGYSSLAVKYFSLVELSGNKKELMLVPVHIYNEKEYLTNPEKYINNQLGNRKTVSRVLIKFLKIDSILEIDKFRIHISGTTGEQFTFKPAMQLVLDYKYEVWIKQIDKYLDNVSKNMCTKDTLPRDIKGNPLTRENNCELYQVIADKLTTSIFKVIYSGNAEELGRKKPIGLSMKNNFSEFESLSFYEQCIVLMEILKLLHNNGTIGNLKLISIKTAKNVRSRTFKCSEIKSLYLVNQSVTGLFENKVDLFKL